MILLRFHGGAARKVGVGKNDGKFFATERSPLTSPSFSLMAVIKMTREKLSKQNYTSLNPDCFHDRL
jgi:hypothetical protein